MRWIVLPLASPDICAVAAADVVDTIAAADVRVAVEVVIVVYVDVTAAPAGAPTPAASPGGAHGQADAERDRTGGDHRTR